MIGHSCITRKRFISGNTRGKRLFLPPYPPSPTPPPLGRRGTRNYAQGSVGPAVWTVAPQVKLPWIIAMRNLCATGAERYQKMNPQVDRNNAIALDPTITLTKTPRPLPSPTTSTKIKIGHQGNTPYNTFAVQDGQDS